MPENYIESEKKLERKLVTEIKSRGGWAIKLSSQHIFGLPDRLCLLPGGGAFFVEVKTTKKKPTKIQKVVHNKLRGMGFMVYVIDSSEQIKDLMEEYE